MMHRIPVQCVVVALACAALVAAIPLTARAELLAYEGFEYDAGPLTGQDGGQGAWTDPWVQGGGFGGGSDWQVDAPSLSYTDSAGRTLVTTGGAARADAGDDNIQFLANRPWDTTGHRDDGDVVWFSYLFNHSSGDTADIRIFVLGSGNFAAGAGPFISSSNTDIHVRIQQNTSSIVTGGYNPIAHDQDHFLVGRFTFSDEGEDELRYWLDPDLDAIPLDTAPNSGAVTGTIPTGWTDFYMRHASGPGTDMMDEIRIGTDFNSVVAIVPEPAAALSLVLPGTLVLLRRRPM